jgi:hypothetical protein
LNVARELTCPCCRGRLRVADEFVGQGLTCPRCLEEIPTPGGEAGATVGASTVQQDVKRSLSWLDLGFLIAGGLCLLGMFVVLLATRGDTSRHVSEDALIGVMVCTAALDLVAVSWIGTYVVRWITRSGRGVTFGRILLGLVMFGALAIAAVVVFFFTCLAVVLAGG